VRGLELLRSNEWMTAVVAAYVARKAFLAARARRRCRSWTNPPIHTDGAVRAFSIRRESERRPTIIWQSAHVKPPTSAHFASPNSAAATPGDHSGLIPWLLIAACRRFDGRSGDPSAAHSPIHGHESHLRGASCGAEIGVILARMLMPDGTGENDRECRRGCRHALDSASDDRASRRQSWLRKVPSAIV